MKTLPLFPQKGARINEKIRVLVGGKSTRDAFTDLVADIISSEFGGPHIFEIKGIEHATQIAGYLATKKVDLFVSFVNSILFPHGNMPPSARIAQAVAFVAHHKRLFDTGIVAVSGVDVREDLSLVGVEHYFKLPFCADVFGWACRACLMSLNDQRSRGAARTRLAWSQN